jgi:hypothetical protein
MAWTNGPATVYHGTTQTAAYDIQASIDLAKCKPINDFGLGFYVTTHLNQAKERANSRYVLSHAKTYAKHGSPLSPNPVAAAVVEFTLDRLAIASLDALVFVRPTPDWKDFVAYCRSGGRNHFPSGSFYDVVYGPVSVIGGEVKPDSDQISFHSLAAIRVLTTRRIMLGNPAFA